MSYRHTLQAAIESLNEIEDLVRGFPENGHIPAVEIDLALQKLRNVYELLLLFRNIDKTHAIAGNAAKETQETVILQTVEQTTKVRVPDAETTETQKKSVVKQEEHNIIEKSSEKSTEQVIEKKEIQVKKTKIEKNVQTLADQFKERTTLLESLQQSYNAEPVTPGKPINDLMSAIAINDRFSYIRELFNNDKTSFENAIQVLNNSADFNEAYKYMMQEFDWDMESNEVQSLLDLVRRKYIKRKNG